MQFVGVASQQNFRNLLLARKNKGKNFQKKHISFYLTFSREAFWGSETGLVAHNPDELA